MKSLRSFDPFAALFLPYSYPAHGRRKPGRGKRKAEERSQAKRAKASRKRNRR